MIPTKVWVKKEAVLAATHSTRVRAWANTHTFWIPGSLQRNERHLEKYRIYFQPTPGYSRIMLDVPSDSVQVDVNQARRLFKAGPTIEAFDQAWDVLRK